MKTIDIGRLAELARTLSAAGYRVVAPLDDNGVIRLKEWTPGAALALPAVPVNSVKDFLFPRSEVVARFALGEKDFTPVAVERSAPKTVVLGARPCDTAALAALDAVFNWDYKDGSYNARREALSVVSLACAHRPTSTASAPAWAARRTLRRGPTRCCGPPMAVSASSSRR
jgi:hypothetical protein